MTHAPHSLFTVSACSAGSLWHAGPLRRSGLRPAVLRNISRSCRMRDVELAPFRMGPGWADGGPPTNQLTENAFDYCFPFTH